MEYKIDWHEGYANEPEIRLVLDTPKPDWSKIVHQTCPINESTAAVAFDKGIAHYGIYHNLNGERQLATRPGEYLITVEENGKQVQKKFDAWSSSRASVMNVLFPDVPTILDMWTTVGNYGHIGYATLDLVKANWDKIPKGINFLIVEKVEKKNVEDGCLKILPSLSPYKFKLPVSKEWQEEELNKKYRVLEVLRGGNA